MSRYEFDERFSGIKSESYLTHRYSPKKDEVTGEAKRLIQDFIQWNLNAPLMRKLYREWSKNDKEKRKALCLHEQPDMQD
jgi:hypothetical protein